MMLPMLLGTRFRFVSCADVRPVKPRVELGASDRKRRFAEYGDDSRLKYFLFSSEGGITRLAEMPMEKVQGIYMLCFVRGKGTYR